MAAGLVRSRKSRATGTVMSIYNAELAAIDVGVNKYAVVCETHSTIVGTDSVKDGKVLSRTGEFCEPCRGAIDLLASDTGAPMTSPIQTPDDRCPKCNSRKETWQIKCSRCWSTRGKPQSKNRKVDTAALAAGIVVPSNGQMEALATLPVPVDAEGKPAHACVVFDNHYHLAWQVGRQKIKTGLVYEKVREATTAAAFLNRRIGE